MKAVFEQYGTRILGATITFFGTVGGLVTTGAFDRVMSEENIIWLGIVCTVTTAVLGGATFARGSSNATAERVASAMQTAIRAIPKEPSDA